MNGTTSVPKSIPRLVLDKVKLQMESENILPDSLKTFVSLVGRTSLNKLDNCFWWAFKIESSLH